MKIPMKIMIAKFRVTKVETLGTEQRVEMQAVTNKPFDAEGNSDDNSFARWTPSGELKMHITNPALVDALPEGKKFYLEFRPAQD